MFFKKKPKIKIFSMLPWNTMDDGYVILSRNSINIFYISGTQSNISVGDILNLYTIDDPGLSNRALDYRNSPYKVLYITYSDPPISNHFNAVLEFIKNPKDIQAWNQYKLDNNTN